MVDLQIAEIPYPSGAVRFRYSRYLATDGSAWVRHGLFCSYHEDGSLASQGSYEHALMATQIPPPMATSNSPT